MPYGNLQFEITREQLDDMLQKVEALNSMLHEAVVLNTDDKLAGLRLGTKTEAFLQRSIESAENFPHLVPAHVSIDDLKEDYDTASKLQVIATTLRGLLIYVEDTRKALMLEGTRAGLAIYRQAHAQHPFGVGGTEIVLKTLGAFMPRKGKTTKKPSSEIPPQKGTVD